MKNQRKREANPNSEYLSSRDACAVTGVPMSVIRNGCRAGTIPHVVCGKTFYVNMAALRSMLAEAARTGRAI